ncbi:hypothetical protein [Pseudonocardia broussonetiae]|uniref:DUF2267 domain-containing protein n=1 Tax=Pseudonocardia broussonetiae TaxID=2736640 RepID=A0A6M6JEA2_9PSEU|nr:hypothetical protein [Pseudonocardia broussonetiae]QJY44791.1 hypothetical protein HOP40_02160 [Pseudonocardia broussonetiae]
MTGVPEARTTTGGRATAAAGPTVVGVLADPGAPAELAHRLAEELPALLAAQQDGDRGWDVRVEVLRLPPQSPGHRRLLDAVGPRMREGEWALTVCLTDSPLRGGAAPLAGELLGAEGVVVVSVPAFGGVALHRRIRGVVAELVTAAGRDPEERADRRTSALVGPFRRVVPDEEPENLHVLASRGRLRLLAGMVRDNRPWRLVPSLSGALAAALATGAYVVVTSSIWQLADMLGPVKLVIAMVFAVAAMVAWLILDHHLWERPSGTLDREEVRLYNASTVITLTVGVGCLYAGLFVVIALTEHFLIAPGYFESNLGHPVGLGDYLTLAWFATSLALVAGALGSGFENEDDVRQAAYGFRERERREGPDGEDGSDDRR